MSCFSCPQLLQLYQTHWILKLVIVYSILLDDIPERLKITRGPSRTLLKFHTGEEKFIFTLRKCMPEHFLIDWLQTLRWNECLDFPIVLTISSYPFDQSHGLLIWPERKWITDSLLLRNKLLLLQQSQLIQFNVNCQRWSLRNQLLNVCCFETDFLSCIYKLVDTFLRPPRLTCMHIESIFDIST